MLLRNNFLWLLAAAGLGSALAQAPVQLAPPSQEGDIPLFTSDT